MAAYLKYYFIYVVTSKRNGTLYVGVTSDLERRVFEHKMHLFPGFTSRYNVCRLVYYEMFHEIEEAIRREKQLKKWNRQWKLRLIEQHNPAWLDLCGNDGQIKALPIGAESI